jgi:predicted nuclease of predicted toxin-antitoxin system
MKFLVDENVGRSIVEYLSNRGFDTKSVSELYPSRDDASIIEVAQ